MPPSCTTSWSSALAPPGWPPRSMRRRKGFRYSPSIAVRSAGRPALRRADAEVALVGGGNSAGQATVFLATRARRVTLIARRPLEQTMSQYLIERIRAQPNIDVVIGCEISALEGAGGELEAVSWRDRGSGTVTKRPVRYLLS